MRNVEKLNPGDSVDHFFLIHRATQGVTDFAIRNIVKT